MSLSLLCEARGKPLMRGRFLRLPQLRTEWGGRKVDLFTVHVAVTQTAFTATERQAVSPGFSYRSPAGCTAR